MKDARESTQGTLVLERLTGDKAAQKAVINKWGTVTYPNFSTNSRVYEFEYNGQKWARLHWINGDGSDMPICAARVCAHADDLERGEFVLFASYLYGWHNAQRSSSIVREGKPNEQNDYRTTQSRVIIGFLNWATHVKDYDASDNWRHILTASKPFLVNWCEAHGMPIV